MEKKRIGKTLKIRWAILTGGEPEPLAGRDLTLEISSGNRVRTTLSFVADGNVAAFVFEGSEQRYVGPYTVTMWENLGKEGQTVVDRCDAFCLVARSCEEAESGSSEDPGLEIESLDLGTSNFEAGVPGASAYELFKKYNPDSELTEEEYAEVPVRAAGAALAMVEQLEETESAMKQAEQLRKQAEQGREASEQARATAEQGRVAAEQQRALAEQTRVTNESARQTNEAGRQAAETKREENTAEAIRNSEEATRKAEDEAARVRMLADNPPKIVEVDGAKYWAFWDEETGQYVVSENRADVGDAVLFSQQTLTPQQQEQARANIGAFAKSQFGGPQYYAIDTSLFPQISAFNPEDTIYDDETDTIYSILNFPVNLLVAVKNLKVVKAHTYRMIYERNDSSIVLIGDYIYATIGGDMTFLRRINKETLEEELAVSYTGLIDGTVGCGLYVAGDKLFLRAKDNILYLVDKEELTISDTGFHDITTICNVTKDVIAFADGSNIYLYDGESVINQINIPAEYSDIKYLNNYRGKYTAHDLKYLIASVDNAKALLYIDIVESRFIKGSTPLITGVENKFVGYKRIFNLHNTDYMCIASKDSNLAGTCNYILNRPYITGIFQTGFYLIDAFLYGDKDIYCTYGGYFMR